MTANQCIALQVYVIAVVRYLEAPCPNFERLLEEDKAQLERVFNSKPIPAPLVLQPVDLFGEKAGPVRPSPFAGIDLL